MATQCTNSIAELLVDYSDGELSETDARRVENHLAACGACRTELQRLERSLAAARAVWREAAKETVAAGMPTVGITKQTPRRWAIPAAIPAAVAVAAVVLLAVLPRPAQHVQRQHDQPVKETVQTAIAADSIDRSPPQTLDDLLASIDRAERRARLVAAAELLETEPELKEYAMSARAYLASAYGEEENGDPKGSHDTVSCKENEI